MEAVRPTGKPQNRVPRRMGAVILLALVLLASALMGTSDKAWADEAPGGIIGAVHVGPNTRYCSNFADLKSELEAQKNKTVTVEMYCDWDWSVMTSRLVIPENSRVTIEMGGCKMDRQLAPFGSWQDDGEVILVRSGAMLTINGQPEGRTYEAYVYESLDGRPVARGGFAGGLITGGASTDGAGGIHVNKGATVTLNDVTITGCRAQKGKAAKVGSVSCGYGGGLYLAGGDITVNLNNSTITGNYASGDGGGIYADSVGAIAINLVNSHIDANLAASDGGGIHADGKGMRIMGDAILDDSGTTATGSTISGNQCAERGGGAMANAGGFNVRRIVMESNRAAQGGALFDAQDSATLNGLVIRGNAATDKGGGIYFEPFLHTTFGYTGDSAIAGCLITGNSAGAQGGGVYCDDYTHLNESRKRVFSGTTSIKDNTNGNLVIESSEWRSKSEVFDLVEGADVRVAWLENGEKKRTWSLVDENCAKYVHSDEAGYQYIFDVEQRFINRIADEDAPAIATVVEVTAANANDASKAGKSSSLAISGKVGAVGVGGGSGSDYNLIRGFASHGGANELSAFYYSDALFYPDPYTYNEHLATASLTLSYCGGYMDNSAEKDESGNTYYNKHWGVRQFLADIGCSDQDIYVNDNMLVKPGTDSIGVSIGSKELARADGVKTGDILIPIAVRGFGYEAEWVSNVTIGYAAEMGRGKEAKGFSEAADQVFTEIEYYLKKHNLEEDYRAGRVKFWVTGFSRAGATANLVGKRLVDKIAADGCASQVFCYSCEAPKGGTDDAEVEGNDYRCIHNILNKVDIVPYVAPGQMGFKRYGVDHYIPGTAAGAVKTTVKDVTRGGASGPPKTTTYADNDVTYTKTSAYEEQKVLMKTHLLALAPNKVFYDYFSPMAMDFVSTDGFLHKYYDGYTDRNHIEDFVEDFIWLLTQKSNISRDKYAKDGYKLGTKTYSSIQAAARDLMKIAKVSNGLDGVISGAGGIKDQIPYVSVLTFFMGPSIVSSADFSLAGFYLNVIGEWGDLSDTNKVIWTGNLWNAFKKSGALDKLSAEDKEKFEAAFPTLLDVALTVVDSDYNYKPVNNQNNQWAKGSTNSMMYLPTLIEYLDYILQCHDPNVCLAWAESYDSWYAGEIDNFKLAQPASVAAPKAYGTAGGARQELAAGINEANRLPGDQHIVLDNDAIVGEAVYYDLVDVTGGNKTLASNRLYRGGIDLARGNAATKTYKIVAYDMSYGVKGDSATFNVTLYDSRHTVIVQDLTAGEASGTQASGQGVLSGQGSGDGGLELMAGRAPGLVAGGATDGSLLGAASSEMRERIRTFTFEENQKAVVRADEPSSKFFKEWKVEVLDAGSEVLEEDVADDLLHDVGKDNIAANFTMPEGASGVYPADYQLRFVALYGARITTADVGPTTPGASIAPEAGQNLANEMKVTFNNGKSGTYTPMWTYTYDGKTAPASGTALYETAYTATIHIDQDKSHENAEDDIVFASNVRVETSQGTAEASVEPDARGGITITIAFAETVPEPEPPPQPPVPTLALTVNTIDRNTSGQASDPAQYAVHPGSVATITAPSVQDEVFYQWDFGHTGIAPDSDDPDANMRETVTINIPSGLSEEVEITAQYIPIVNELKISLLDDEGNVVTPEGGKAAPTNREAKVTISNVYEVHPNNLKLTWSPALPEDGTFEYLTDYTASVEVQRSVDGTVQVKREGAPDSDYTPVNLVVLPAANMRASFNGETDGVYVGALEVSKTFPETDYVLGSVKQPDDIGDVPHDKADTADKARALLPGKTRILTKNGVELDADIQWNSVEVSAGGQDRYAAIAWKASGEVKLPETVINPDDVSLAVSMTVSVDDAGTAPSPTVSPDPGTYVYNQVATFGPVDQNATIYYTTDGSDPTTSGTCKPYAGEQIYVSRAEANQYDEETGYRMSVIKAYTVDGEKRPSDVAEFHYVFFDVFIPNGAQLEYTGAEQIGVEGSPFYTLEILEGPAGARIDEDGNVVATLPGVYKVRAHLNDPVDSWQLDGRGGRGKEDQVIEFVINAEYTVKFVNDDGTVLQSEVLDYGTLPTYRGDVPQKAADEQYSYVFKGWTPEIVPVVADATYTAVYEAVPVSGPAKASLVFDLDGGTIDGKTSLVIVANVGDVIEIPGPPVRDGYTFEYWQGSQHYPGDKYTVEGDHTFKAIWKPASSPTRASPSKTQPVSTGDAVIGIAGAFALIAIVAAAVMFIARRIRRTQ